MTTDSILLIHPPVVKPSEPPPGIAKLAGALQQHNVKCTVLDANLEGLHYLCGQPIQAEDTWTRRAATHVEKNLTQLTTPDTFHHPDRYRQAVINVNRVLSRSTLQKDVQISLSNFSSNRLSPVKSDDLIRAFETPSENPFFSYFDERLKPLLTREQPSLFGISINFLSQALCAFAMIGVIRQLLPKANITAGGGLITSWLRQDRWQNRFTGIIDHLVPGPGEKALLSMVGVEIKEDPALPVYQKQKAAPYLSPGFILPYSASRGCYWRKCAFCPENSEKTTYRPTPPATVTAQLKSLSVTYAPTLIHLTDNALSPALLQALMEKPPGPPWYGFARLTHHFTDKDYCMALKKSGCVMMQIGLESGSQAVLDAFGKGIDLRKAEKSLVNLKQVGIAAYVYLLFGTPWETEKDAEMTYDFTVRHASNISFLNLAIFNLPAAATTAEDLSTTPFYSGDLSLYSDFNHPDGWHRHQVRQFLDKKFRRHPAIAKIIRRDPPTFTSNHAPFFSPHKWM
jgi:radical SAM family protein